MTQVKDRGDSYSNGLMIGFRMVQVAIGKLGPLLSHIPVVFADGLYFRYHRRTLLLVVHRV